MNDDNKQVTERRKVDWITRSSLRESFRAGECIVCSNQIASERHSIHSFLYEGMMSPEVRGDFLAGGGFCARHFWVAKRIEEECWHAGGIGLALLCEDLLKRVASAVPPLTRGASASPFDRARLGPLSDDQVASRWGCFFCTESWRHELDVLVQLDDLVFEPEWRELLLQSSLCVRHAWLASGLWKNVESLAWLRSRFEAQVTELSGGIAEFVGKQDWQHRKEPRGEEKFAVARTISFLVGLSRQFPVRELVDRDGSNGQEHK